MFVDEVTIDIKAGDGGPGLVAWRREKFVVFGGPYGGDGGHGGAVVLEAQHNLSTLMDLRYQRHIKAEAGKPGGNKRCTGRSGKDAIIPVPCGTQVYDADTDILLGDLTTHGERLTVADGGMGGRGNARFVTATNQAPTHAQDGIPGGERMLRLELKLLADVGIIGYPSVGKSTLIASISNARPKIASYHFTTLAPNLGVVQWHDGGSYVVADIPGLIEGAADGHGLGHQFLRHIERCRILVHMLEVPPDFDYEGGFDWTERDPVKDFERVNKELALFNIELADRPQIVVINKADLPQTEPALAALEAHFTECGYPLFVISSATRSGIGPLIDGMGKAVKEMKAKALAEAASVKDLLWRAEDEVPNKAALAGEAASGLGRHTESSDG